MLNHFFVLDLPPDASDEEIRKKYFQLVKKHTPEKDPLLFKKITSSYEAVKERRNRIKKIALGNSNSVGDYEEKLRSLVTAQDIKRKRVGLYKLFDKKAVNEK